MKKLLLTLFTTVLITATALSQGEQRYANGTATDQDGNTFEWINYGTQDWAIENSEVVTYRDGTPIPQVTDASEWASLTTGAWCFFDNDPTKGKLYNWYAVAGIHDNDENTPNKEFAPEGWHVPSVGEWSTLGNYLITNGYNFDGTTTGNKIAKSMSSTAGWAGSTIEGSPGNNQLENNSSGFNSLPVGYGGGDYFEGYDSMSFFWTSEFFQSDAALYKFLKNFQEALNGSATSCKTGMSVRFVRDSSSVGANGDILLNGTVSAENNQIKNVADPTEAQDAVTLAYINQLESSNDDLQEQVDNLETILQAQIDNLQAQIDALQPSTSVTDQDGNSYNYLTYGDQVWTVENAEMVTYRDGTPIPQVTDATEWENLTTGAWAYYNNDPTKSKLYNWYAVMGIHDTDPNTPNKEFAPEGWHVPTDADWTTLEEYLIANGYNYDGTTTGNKIAKAMASTTGWNSFTSTGAIGNDQSLNNSSGFNAIPEGFRGNDGSFFNEGTTAIFWSSTENDTDLAWIRSLDSVVSGLGRSNVSKQDGFSVRFVKDN
jgi:uncharacterized protein (TIGR02145 family)